ncbi:flagellar export chaperone FlgN [Lachnospiraceae bacterium LCP25S3_G4]
MRNMSDFTALIKEQIRFFEEAIEIEQQKIESAKKNRITFVEDCMVKEQAMVLKLKGFDRKREELQSDLGFTGYTFAQIIAAASIQEQEILKPLYTTLNERVALFRSTCDSAKSIMEINLHTINQLISKAEDTSMTNYGQDGMPKQDTPQHFTSKII